MVAVDFNDHWQLGFANFTLKLLEIVMLGPADDLFFDLEVNPLGQTLQVDGTT